MVHSQDERQRVALLLEAQRAGDEVQVLGQIGTPQTTVVDIVFNLLAKYSYTYFMRSLSWRDRAHEGLFLVAPKENLF